MKEIPLSRGLVAIVDDEDFDWLNQWKWYAGNNGKARTMYAIRMAAVEGKRRKFRMHREIMNPPDGMEVDHINHNGLDNRRSNLRIVTSSQNSRNTRKPRTGRTSKYKGVTYEKDRVGHVARWRVGIRINGKHKWLGRFRTEVEAARAMMRPPFSTMESTHA